MLLVSDSNDLNRNSFSIFISWPVIYHFWMPHLVAWRNVNWNIYGTRCMCRCECIDVCVCVCVYVRVCMTERLNSPPEWANGVWKMVAWQGDEKRDLAPTQPNDLYSMAKPMLIPSTCWNLGAFELSLWVCAVSKNTIERRHQRSDVVNRQSTTEASMRLHMAAWCNWQLNGDGYHSHDTFTAGSRVVLSFCCGTPSRPRATS